MKLTLIIRMAIGITCILISFSNHFSDVASMFFVRYECRLLLWLVNLNLSRESDQMTVLFVTINILYQQFRFDHPF